MTLSSNHVANYVTEPLRVNDESEVDWSDQADVVVVGFGGAGACVALEAVNHGAEVIAVDRFEGGGATALSGGIIYGGGTPYQKAAGVDDSADQMFNYLRKEIGDAVREETLRRFCNESSNNFAWMVENGLGFGSNLYKGKRSYPPKGYDIYYSGNEAAPDYAKVAKPAQRGHKVQGEGYTGVTFFKTLAEKGLSKGVRLKTHAVVRRLVVDANGAVIGVEAGQISAGSAACAKQQKILKKVNAYQRFFEKASLKSLDAVKELEQEHGRPLFIRAKKGVVLSTGSFAFNREMVRHYAPNYINAMPLGTISCDGSGVVLGQSVGGDVGHMDSVTAWRSISPPESFVRSIVVNMEGQRFIPEDAYLGHLGYGISQQRDQRAWLIIDSKTYWRAFIEVIPRWGEEGYVEFRGPLLANLLFNTKRGKTLRHLAEKLGINAEALEEEVAVYNQGVEAGKDRLAKKPENCALIGKGAYYAIEISLGSKVYACPTIPMGGLVVDEDRGLVLDKQGAAIKGLYAAGRAAVGIPSGFYVSGSSLADCVFSGRRAGRDAALSES